VPLQHDAAVFQLYERYCTIRHDTTVTRKQYTGFLGSSPLDTEMMLYRVSDRLVGVGWIDVLHDGLSSVYFAFEPDERARSLGTFSVMEELREVERRGKHWLYLGFYVQRSPKMDYKSKFGPHELLIDGEWKPGTEELHEELRAEAEKNPGE
jgi:arginine-tRNA-protein transferase